MLLTIIGYCSALGAAVAWALGSILFRRLGDHASPMGMNLVKCLIGLAYLGIVLLCIGRDPVGTRVFILLGVSGLLGIALGDTFFFKALVSLGPKMTLLLATLGPVVTVILAVVFLRERLSLAAIAGITITLTGIAIVTWSETPVGQEARAIRLSGIFYSILSVAAISSSIIIAKIAIVSAPALQGTFIRLEWAAVGLGLWGIATRQLRPWIAPFKDPSIIRLTFIGAFVVIFGGFFLFLLSLKYIDASIATVLEATTPIWVLPMAAMMRKERIRPIEICGAILAVAGVSLILLS